LAERYLAALPVQEKVTGFNGSRIPQPIKGNNNFSFNYGKENKSEIAYSYYGKFEEMSDKEILSFLLLTDILQIQANQKLREEMGSTYAPRVNSSLQRKPIAEFLLALNVSSLPENTGKIVQAFQGLVNNIKEGKMPVEDLSKAKTQRLRVFETQGKTNDFWAFSLDQCYSFQYDPAILTEYAKRLESIGTADIIAVANKLLSSANTLNATMNPEK
jgi:zinc protease